jgi:hypothetical protein
MICLNASRRIVPWSFGDPIDPLCLCKVPKRIYWPTFPIHHEIQMIRGDIQGRAVHLQHLGWRMLRLSKFVLLRA